MSQKFTSQLAFKCFIILMLALSVTVEPIKAQSSTNYYVTVNPTTPDSPMYTTVGMNWTMSFEALWSYGDDSGTAINNATVTIQVYNSKNEAVNTLSLNTATGLFSFNYSSLTADIFTFTPIKLVTEEGTEWTSNLIDADDNLYGFTSESVVVWWDTFHVSLISYDAETPGVSMVFVNVTYLLLPEAGLTLPEWATYSHQTFLPKTAYNANITINGVRAKKASDGIFTANVSTWLPTAYIHVAASQENWTTTYYGFSFDHNANQPFWLYLTVFCLMLATVVVIVRIRSFRKLGHNVLSLETYPFLGGILLVIVSLISIYWGLIGLDSTLHGFDWMLLAILGFLSFGFGITAALLSFRKKIQSLIIFVINMPMITNLIVAKTSLDMYELTNPWLILIASFVLSFICALLICNADEAFK